MTTIETLDQTSQQQSLRDIVDDRAQSLHDAPWLLSLRSSETISYRELLEKVNEWHITAASHGLTKGDRVGILIFDPVVYAVTYVALLCAGFWVAPLDPNVLYSNVSQLDERARFLKLRCIISDRKAPVSLESDWLEVTATGSQLGVTSTRAYGSTSDGGVILATSGTSGTPKVMALPTEQLLCASSLIARHNGLNETERGFNPLPLWHINAEVVGVLATLDAGASLVLDSGFHRTDFWSLMDSFEVTWINAVPAIISRLIELQPGESVPARIKFIRSASAPLSTMVLSEFEEATGISVIESYGMTEAASQICANPVRGKRKHGSVGPAVGVELRVVPSSDDDGDVFADGVGHVEIRGPSVIRRYEGAGYEDRFSAEGWLRTGDLGYLDDEGYLFLVGRNDDVINRSGEKIFPREIEDVILGVRGVVVAAVVGEAHPVFGQVPVAYVELEEVGSSTSNETVNAVVGEIESALMTSFARTRRPVRLIIVEKIPVHATGKVQKKLLRAEDLCVICETSLS
jgi:acyl-CoA synthetase (AMP-forming)/AMP-acid ligase II